MPALVEAMERHGHLRLTADVRTRLLRISPATVDRLLRPEREKVKLGVTTTELLSKVVFRHMTQAATWSISITSIPSLNLIPVITFAR